MKKLYLIIVMTIGFAWQMAAQSPLCESYPTTFCCEYVSSVTINGVTRAGAPDDTGFSSGPGYFDYTSEVISAFVAGTTYPVSVTVKTNSSYQEFVKIWFDFNGNGNLNDSGELVFDQVNTFNGTYVYSGNVTVPTTAFNGEVYIRVVMVYANSPALCGTYSYGTTLDFKASISGGIDASNLTVATTTSGGYSGNVVSSPSGINTGSSMTTADFATGTNITLTATPNTGGTFINWSGDASGSTNPLTITLNSDMNITANFGPSAPADPTSVAAGSSTICSGSSTSLTASGASGTVYWYSGSCGGTLIGTGNPISVSPTSTTTYYARNYTTAYSTGCASTTITVNPLLQFRSTQSGSWTTLANWQQYDGTSWVAATSYPGQVSNSCASPLVTIRTGHQMEISGIDITLPNLKMEGSGKLTVETSGKLNVSGQLQLEQNAAGAIVIK